LSLDVRIYQPGEKGKQVRRWLFWPVIVLLIAGAFVFLAMVGPHMLGMDQKIENKMVWVQIANAPDTRPEVVATVGEKHVSARIPDMSVRGPGGSASVLLEKLSDADSAKLYANKYAAIQNAQIQRVIGDDVIAVGSSPADEIFVHIPQEAKPSDKKDWGPQLDAKARVNVAGYLRQMPSPEQAKVLLRLKDLSTESKPLGPLYMEAKTVRVVANKPALGED
jgi:hypothetical protein